jgi:hypothetical protein
MANETLERDRAMRHLEEFSLPSADTIVPFMTALEQARQGNDFDDWRAFTQKSALLRKWRYFLSLDPYTRWGLLKPRGYPGDATLMDFVYGHPSIRQDVVSAGPMGEAIYRHTSGAASSASARLRIQLIAKEIASTAKAGPFTVASYASGHARELEQLPAEVAKQVSLFMAIDVDDQSLDEARRSAGPISFEGFKRNVIKQDLADLPEAKLVYSLGLFDYLNDEYATLVIRKMLAQTESGGTALLANLAPSAANLGYCEAIMDWWMLPRTENDLLRLADSAIDQGGYKATVDQQGCFNYLRIQK